MLESEVRKLWEWDIVFILSIVPLCWCQALAAQARRSSVQGQRQVGREGQRLKLKSSTQRADAITHTTETHTLSWNRKV